MKVSKVKKTKEKVIIQLDNDEKLELFPSVFAEYNLYINKIIDNNELKSIKKTNSCEKYFVDAVKRLLIHEYSPKNIEEFLKKKGANKEQTNFVVEKLRKFGFIDERKLMKELLEISDRRHYGFNRIKKLMIDKKISPRQIEKLEYNSIREKNEAKIHLEILVRKFKNKNNFQLKKSVFSGLVRQGFEEQLSLELVNKISNSNNNHEINVLKLDYDKYFLKYSKKYSSQELDRKITSCLLSKGYRLNDINVVKENKI